MRKRPTRPIDKDVLAGKNFGPELDATALDTPERIIEYFRENGFVKNGQTNIEEAIKENPEIELIYEDLGEDDAYIMKLGEKRFRISVNSSHHKNRQRFSMAHEYVHYQLHRDRIGTKPEGERVLYRNAERNPVEFQANQVAGELLMPEDEFRLQVKKLSGDVQKISEVFSVSPGAVRIRAEKLGWKVY